MYTYEGNACRKRNESMKSEQQHNGQVASGEVQRRPSKPSGNGNAA